MRVCVTGGAGFVGRHFTQHFLEQGDHVTIVDDLSAGLEPWTWPVPISTQANFSFRQFDSRSMIWRMKADDYDLIIHCAAVVGGRQTIEGDPIKVATDLSIDADFFQWVCAPKHNRPKVIYFSSSAVYPVELQAEEKHVRLAESLVSFDSTRVGIPDLTYGWAKLTGEFLAKHAIAQHGLDCIIYRPFSGYGDDQDTSYPFPAILRRVLSGTNPVVVWGSGKQERDFIHIDDVVRGVVRTMDMLKPGESLNLGSGTPTSFMDLAVHMGDVIGRKVVVKPDPTKPTGVFSRVADTYKLNQLYKPTVTLEEGISRAAKFLTSRKPRSSE